MWNAPGKHSSKRFYSFTAVVSYTRPHRYTVFYTALSETNSVPSRFSFQSFQKMIGLVLICHFWPRLRSRSPLRAGIPCRGSSSSSAGFCSFRARLVQTRREMRGGRIPEKRSVSRRSTLNTLLKAHFVCVPSVCMCFGKQSFCGVCQFFQGEYIIFSATGANYARPNPGPPTSAHLPAQCAPLRRPAAGRAFCKKVLQHPQNTFCAFRTFRPICRSALPDATL